MMVIIVWSFMQRSIQWTGGIEVEGDLQTIRFFQKKTFPSLYMHNLDFFSKEIDVQSTTIVGIPRPASPTLTDRQWA